MIFETFRAMMRQPGLMEEKQRMDAMNEFGLMIGTGMAAEPLAGLTGILGASTGDLSTDYVNKVRDKMTYQPKSEKAVQAMEAAEPYIAKAGDWIDKQATNVEDYTGIPREAVIAGPLMGLEAFGGGQVLNQVGRLTRNVPSVSQQFGERGMVRAFHGTPHKIGKEGFKMDKIGTGEGAQAYGHGLYFAESEGVAKQYAKNIPHSDVKRNFLAELPEDADFDDVLDLVGTGHFSAEQDEVIKALNNDDWLGFDYPSQAVNQAYENLDNFDPSPELLKAVEGNQNLYNVSLDVNPEDLLDWDAPLSKQPKHMQELAAKQFALESGITPAHENYDAMVELIRGQLTDKTGKDLHNSIVNRLGMDGSDSLESAQEAVSKYLNSEGIPGIRYLDGNSRKAGEGTSNYVMFDDELISIDSPGLMDDVPSASLMDEVGDPVGYDIIDMETGKTVGHNKTSIGATRSVDRRDMKHGGARYRRQPVYKDDTKK